MMRRVSKKRRQLLSRVKPFREAFKIEIGCCELCGKKRGLALHEIARGPARALALDKRYAILCLCDPGCHQIVEKWPRPKQLMLLTLRRPRDYNLEGYSALAGRRVFHEDVYAFEQEVKDACTNRPDGPVVWPLYRT